MGVPNSIVVLFPSFSLSSYFMFPFAHIRSNGVALLVHEPRNTKNILTIRWVHIYPAKFIMRLPSNVITCLTALSTQLTYCRITERDVFFLHLKTPELTCRINRKIKIWIRNYLLHLWCYWIAIFVKGIFRVSTKIMDLIKWSNLNRCHSTIFTQLSTNYQKH